MMSHYSDITAAQGGNLLVHNTSALLDNRDILSLVKTIGCGGKKLFLQTPANLSDL